MAISPLDYFLVALAAGAVGAPGYLLLRALTSLDEGEALAAGFGVSFLGMFLSSFAAFLLRADPAVMNLAGLALLTVVAVALAARRKRLRPLPRREFLLLALGLVYLHILLLQALLPVYTGGFMYRDWLVHFGVSKFYLAGGAWPPELAANYPLYSRPPLFNILCGFYMSLFGASFWVYQVASSLLSAVFVLPACLLARRWLRPQAARLVPLLLVLLPFFSRMETWPWPKLLATYFILLSLYFHLDARGREPSPGRSRSLLLFGLFAALALLSHSLSLFYIGLLFLEMLSRVLLRRRAERPGGLRAMVACMVVVGVVLLPWYGWAAATYGPRQAFTANPALGSGSRLTPVSWAQISAAKAVLTFVPGELPFYLLRWATDSMLSPEALARLLPLPGGKSVPLGPVDYREKLYDSFLSYYFFTFPGGLTTALSAAVVLHLRRAPGPRGFPRWLLGWVRPRRVWTTHGGVAAFLLLGSLLGGSAAIPYWNGHGLTSEGLLPSMVLLVLGAAYLLGSWSPSRRRWVLLGVAVESLFLLWLQVAFLHLGGVNLASDANQQVKAAAGLQFAWDLLPGWWPLFLGLLLLLHALILRVLLRGAESAA